METPAPAPSVASWETILQHPPAEPFTSQEALIYCYALYRQACARGGFTNTHIPAIERAIHYGAQGPLARRLARIPPAHPGEPSHR